MNYLISKTISAKSKNSTSLKKREKIGDWAL